MRKNIVRALLVSVSAALVAVALTAGALAAGRDKKPNNPFPGSLNAAEVSAVVWSGQANAFVQLVFDRGLVTAVDRPGNTITVQQKASGHIWRVQTFTIPTTAAVNVNGSNARLAKIKVGDRVRIEQSGPVGGTLQVVRIDQRHGSNDLPFPPTTTGGGSTAVGTSANG